MEEALGKVRGEVAEYVPGTLVNKIGNQNSLKTNESKEYARMRDFEDCKRKVIKYHTLTAI